MPKYVNDESTKAAAARIIYIELGNDRNLPQVAKILGKPPEYVAQLEKWQSRFKWVELAKVRDEAYWKKEVAKRRKEMQEKQEKLDKEQGEQAQEMFDLASTNLKEHAKGKTLYAKDAVALWKEAATLQRLAVGAATQRTEMELSANDEGSGTLTIKAEFGIGSMEDDKEREEEEEQ